MISKCFTPLRKRIMWLMCYPEIQLLDMRIPIKDIAQMIDVLTSRVNHNWDDRPFNGIIGDLAMICNNIALKREGEVVYNQGCNIISEEIKEKAIKIQSILNAQHSTLKLKVKLLAQLQLEDHILNSCREQALKDISSNNWLIHKECLHKVRKHRKKKTKTIQLVLPTSLREQVMQTYHDQIMGGHCGYFKTAQKMAQWYWWPSLYKEIKGMSQVLHCLPAV